MTALTPLAACAPAAPEPNVIAGASPERGRAVIAAKGCGACHDIPGVAWPKGKVASSLEGFGDRALIAGTLPNRPDRLLPFLANAPALVPGTCMPPILMTPIEARDAAAYLYTLRGR